MICVTCRSLCKNLHSGGNSIRLSPYIIQCGQSAGRLSPSIVQCGGNTGRLTPCIVRCVHNTVRLKSCTVRCVHNTLRFTRCIIPAAHSTGHPGLHGVATFDRTVSEALRSICDACCTGQYLAADTECDKQAYARVPMHMSHVLMPVWAYASMCALLNAYDESSVPMSISAYTPTVYTLRYAGIYKRINPLVALGGAIVGICSINWILHCSCGHMQHKLDCSMQLWAYAT